MTLRVSLALALVAVSEKAADVADVILHCEAQKAYDVAEGRLKREEARITAARKRLSAQEITAGQTFQTNIATLNSKLEDRSYAIPTSYSPDA